MKDFKSEKYHCYIGLNVLFCVLCLPVGGGCGGSFFIFRKKIPQLLFNMPPPICENVGEEHLIIKECSNSLVVAVAVSSTQNVFSVHFFIFHVETEQNKHTFHRYYKF